MIHEFARLQVIKGQERAFERHLPKPNKLSQPCPVSWVWIYTATTTEQPLPAACTLD